MKLAMRSKRAKHFGRQAIKLLEKWICCGFIYFILNPPTPFKKEGFLPPLQRMSSTAAQGGGLTISVWFQGIIGN